MTAVAVMMMMMRVRVIRLSYEQSVYARGRYCVPLISGNQSPYKKSVGGDIGRINSDIAWDD